MRFSFCFFCFRFFQNLFLIFLIDQGVKLFRDGLPNFVAFGSSSPPYRPSEKEHAVCRRQVEEFYAIPGLFDNLQNAVNYAWVGAQRTGHIFYGSLNDVAITVKNFLESFLSPLDIDVRIGSEMGIQGIRPDIFIVTKNALLIGVVQVKKPGYDILNNGNVMGELFDQMKLMQLFYGMGPAVGILATGEQFLVAWFPQDHDVFSSAPLNAIGTPVRSAGDSSNSPPGATPSQQNTSIFDIIEDEEDCSSEDIAVYTEDRLLFCTPIFDANHNVPKLMNVLSTALIRMTHSQPNYYKTNGRYLIRFHKGLVKKTTWCALPDSTKLQSIKFHKFPRCDVKTLLAVEDLGRGSNGKAWLVTTEMFSSVCVLKFDNCDRTDNLLYEKDMWHIIYPEFASKVHVEQWSGASALVMPRFATIHESERAKLKNKVSELLMLIEAKGFWHEDVQWKNMGCYKSNGAINPVLFDLIHVRELESPKSDDWIARGIDALFGISQESYSEEESDSIHVDLLPGKDEICP